jgi:hypothetical protein
VFSAAVPVLKLEVQRVEGVAARVLSLLVPEVERVLSTSNRGLRALGDRSVTDPRAWAASALLLFQLELTGAHR